jgi:hypothetical protein
VARVPSYLLRTTADGNRLTHRLDAFRIELPTRVPLQLEERLLTQERRLIRPWLAHRIEGVRNGDDSRRERYLVPDEPIWVPGSVPAFVVAADNRQRLFGPNDRREESHAGHWVPPYPRPLAGSEGTRLPQDPTGDLELADIVEESSEPERPEQRLPDMQPPRYVNGERLHSSSVGEGIGLICFKPTEETLEGILGLHPRWHEVTDSRFGHRHGIPLSGELEEPLLACL